MRNTIIKVQLIIISICFSLCAYAQESYYIVHINGDVKTDQNEQLKVRDKINANDQLVFSSKDDFLVVFSNTSGRKVIRPENKSSESPSFVTYFVNENIFPLKKGISTRGISSSGTNSLADLMTYLENPIIVIQQHNVPIDKEKIGLGEMLYLTVADSIMIPMTDSTLVIDRSLPAGQNKLAIVDKDYGMATPYGNIMIIHKDRGDLLDELKYYEELTGEQFNRKGVINYLKEILGKIGSEDLELLFN